MSPLGLHGSYEQWVSSGSPGLLTQVHQEIQDLLQEHHPLPLSEDAERELIALERRARSGEPIKEWIVSK
jgi:trimethylamine:corrinoid methyltransferase-like protein